MTSRSQLFLLIICSYSRAQHFQRPPGIMTMLVTCVNPAIGSGSTLPSVARLYAWADGQKAMPNLLDSGLKDSSFPQARRLRLAIIPPFYSLFYWSGTFLIITTTQHELKCKVASSAVASKLIWVVFKRHYSWTPVGVSQAWFHFVLSRCG